MVGREFEMGEGLVVEIRVVLEAVVEIVADFGLTVSDGEMCWLLHLKRDLEER